MKNRKRNGAISFEDAVKKTPDIQNCYQRGLRALGQHSARIQLSHPSQCNGSVDIDSCVRANYPQENRWDYAFAYESEVFFVEVHSANTSEVRTVLRKLQWLKDWLNLHAPLINRMQAKGIPYYWISSNGYHILKSSSQHREIIGSGLKPISAVKL